MGVIVTDTSNVVVNQGDSIIQPGSFLLPILPSSYTTGAATDILVQTNVTGDSQYRYKLAANGKQEWGSGSTTVDTNLYRSASNTLKTDGKIIVGGIEPASDNSIDIGGSSLRMRDIYVGGQVKWGSNNAIISNAGTPESAVTATPGSIAMDTTNGRVFFKNSGTGSVGWYNLAGINICTSSTRPNSPYTGMHIYETDTGDSLVYYGATSGWMKPWDTSWGRISVVEGSSDVAIGTGATNLLSTSSITLRNDRIYEVHFTGLFSTFLAGDTATVYTEFVENTTQRRQTSTHFQNTTINIMISPSFHYTPSSTNTNIHRIRSWASYAATTFKGTTTPGQLSITDVGPNGNPPSS